MVAFDASFLILALDEQAAAKQGIPRLTERLDLLLENLRKSKTPIVIPTPALSEFLAKADFGLLEVIQKQAVFRIVPFDIRAAVEAADMTKRSVAESDKKDPVVNATWAKIKFDRQIVAVAKVEGVDAIYSTDPDIAKHAERVNLGCYGIADLPKAPAVQQQLKGLTEDDQRTEQVATGEEPVTSTAEVSGSAGGPVDGPPAAQKGEEEKPEAEKAGEGKPPESGKEVAEAPPLTE